MTDPAAIRIAGWNRAATRFIDPPEFAWEPVAGASAYRVEWRAGGRAGNAEAREPRFGFAPVWASISLGPVEWSVTAGGVRAAFSFHRVPDFDGRGEAPLDWAGAARRNLDWLLSLPPDPDTGEPWFLTHSWHLEPADIVIAYPALHYPSFVALFLAALAGEADLARRGRLEKALEATAGAVMRWRTPDRGIAPRMPVTTRIIRNPGPARAEEGSITVFRAARMGEALLALHGWRPRAEYLDYAEHIAQVLARLQRPDGSWAYRIRPDTGEVVDDYTSGGICTVAFLEGLMAAAGHRRYADSAERAVRWTLENPCRTMRWQGMYEDVGAQEPFANLENWDALDAVAWLCRNRGRVPGAVETARKLNRWVEDQFVIFGPAGTPACTRVHPPAVMEQYVCYYPMEVHTARWLVALAELNRATGDGAYRVKAGRAANAIVRSQFPDGRFSTWGVDTETGKPFNTEGDWYGCNAVAAAALLGLASAPSRGHSRPEPDLPAGEHS